MKKLLLVLAIGAFVACNNGGSEEVKSDSTTVTNTDTVTVPVTPDTTGTGKDTTKVDTTKK